MSFSIKPTKNFLKENPTQPPPPKQDGKQTVKPAGIKRGMVIRSTAGGEADSY